jgi:hypothetical protein
MADLNKSEMALTSTSITLKNPNRTRINLTKALTRLRH